MKKQLSHLCSFCFNIWPHTGSEPVAKISAGKGAPPTLGDVLSDEGYGVMHRCASVTLQGDRQQVVGLWCLKVLVCRVKE